MFKKLILAAAAGAGYVFGAKAGTQRYQQIVAKARDVAGMPAVQQATATVKGTAAPLVDSAKSTVSEKVAHTTHKASGGKGDKGDNDVVSLPATGTGAATGNEPVTGTGSANPGSGTATPAAGAAPSGTTGP